MSVDIDELKQSIANMSLGELREALQFHFDHMKLLHQEVDRRLTWATEVAEGLPEAYDKKK